jgi:hypothetical protein
MAVGIKVSHALGRITLNRSRALGLAAVAGLALVLTGCPGAQSGKSLRLQITKEFDDRAEAGDFWHAGTMNATGVVDTGKLAGMDLNTDYYSDLVGPGAWKASTQQQMGSWIGDCNGVQCDPCTSEFGGEWDLESVIFVLKERNADTYVYDLWLGSTEPPQSGGCEPQINSPVIWAETVPLTLTGLSTANPSGTAAGYTVTLTQ